MHATIANLSPMPREHVAVMTLPRRKAADLPVECSFQCEDGRRWRAVRGRDVGKKTVLRVFTTMKGDEQVRGEIIAKAHPDAAPFTWHKWTSDNLLELIPRLGIAGPTAIRWSDVMPGSLVLLDQSPAHQRWWIRQRVPGEGFYLDWWVDLLADDPVAHFWGKIIWSNRADPSPVRSWSTLILECGEVLAFDFARRYGIGDAVPNGRGGFAWSMNHVELVLKDGTGPSFSGSLLAFDSSDAPLQDPSDWTEKTNRDIASLQAAVHGPVLGVCEDWHPEWLAALSVPRLSEDAAKMLPFAATAHRHGFQQLMQQQAGWHGDRPLGLSRNPGQTGAQGDFGATKGTYAVKAFDPWHIMMMRYSSQVESLRGHNHYEADGQPLRAVNHPQWVTWSRGTHWHTGVSTDRLGKSEMPPVPRPWEQQTVDDEHMSHNYLAAYAMLSDDPLVDDQLRHLLEIDRAGYRFRFPNNGAGATRAQGRTCGAWAQLMTIAGDTSTQLGFSELIRQRVAQTAAVPTLQGAGPMLTPHFGMPDGRKAVFTIDGVLGRWCSLWEIGLWLVGFYQAWQAGEFVTDDSRKQAWGCLVACSRTMMAFGFFPDGEDWRTVADILWSDGAAPPGGMVYPNGPVINGVRYQHIVSEVGTPGVLQWTFAGVLVAWHVLTENGTPPPDHALKYIGWVTDGQEAQTVEGAEWWAIVPFTPAVDAVTP